MARDPVSAGSTVSSALRTFSRPWPILLAGLACTVIGLLFMQTPLVWPRLLFIGAGLLIAGIAVSRRLQTAGWELEDRTESAGLLALAAFVALLAFLGMDEKWDSGRFFLGALIAVALIASFLVLLPSVLRKIILVLLVLLHFGGILTSVTAVAPRNDTPPWLSMQAWTHFYRHYLQFMYLTNAYHFYSPDPGPPTLLWFYVKYDDGQYRWIKLPNREDSPVNLHHQRLLAAAEMTHAPAGLPLLMANIPLWEEKNNRKYEILPGVPHDPWEIISQRREMGAKLPYKDAQGHEAPIQVPVDVLPINQYGEPMEHARRLIASYARHIARTSPHPEDPKVPVSYVRVYQVIHTLITPRQFSEGRDLLDPTTYMPFYMGKYDLDGRLLDAKDPFLFWLLPIVNVPERYPGDERNPLPLITAPGLPGPTKLLNFVEIHATQSDTVQKSD
jgi:hypothetical protein